MRAFWLVLLIAGSLVTACSKTSKSTNPQAAPEIPSKAFKRLNRAERIAFLKRSLLDTVRRYGHLDKVDYRNDSADFVLLIRSGHDTRQRVAVVAIPDVELVVYQYDSIGWRLADSTAYDGYPQVLEITDLNGDDRIDLLISTYAGTSGNRQPYVFMMQVDGRLKYRPDLQQPNLAFDQSRGLMKFFWADGDGGGYKEYYRWRGDSLRLWRGVEYNIEPLVNADGFTEKVTFYHGTHKRRIVDRVLHNHGEIVFDTALFEGHYPPAKDGF